jgi:hypothetical protein
VPRIVIAGSLGILVDWGSALIKAVVDVNRSN